MTPTLANESESLAARRQWLRTLCVAGFLVLLAALAVLPFFVIGEDQQKGCCGGAMPVTHDSWMHYNQMTAFWRGLASGRIYPRWDDVTHGYGAPIFSFYPPGVYYVTSAVYFVTRDWALVWGGFYGLMMLAAAGAIYCYARETMSRTAGLLAAAVYVFAPYHLINQYQRGALGEYASFIWMPLALLFAERLLPEGAPQRLRVRHAAGLAAVFGAFLWTHPPTAYQFALVFGACLAVAALKRRQWRGLLWIVAALVFGSMLAAAYFYPAIGEQHLVNYDNVEYSWPYHASYVFDYTQQVYDRIENPFYARLDYIWVFNVLAILIGAAATLAGSGTQHRASAAAASRLRSAWSAEAAFSRARYCTALHARVWLWTAAGLLASFLMTKYSAPLGRLIPKIELGVFSWRMLTLTSLAMALLAGACVEVHRPALRRKGVVAKPLPHQGRTTNTITNAVVALLILLGAVAVSARYVAWPMWRAQAFAPNPEHFNFATLPRGAVVEAPPMALAQTASGQGRVTITRWQPELREVTVELDAPDQLQFRTYNFAGWRALLDGQRAPLKEGAAGNIVIDVPAGRHQVVLDFRATPLRRASNWITAFASALLVAVLIFTRRRKR